MLPFDLCCLRWCCVNNVFLSFERVTMSHSFSCLKWLERSHSNRHIRRRHTHTNTQKHAYHAQTHTPTDTNMRGAVNAVNAAALWSWGCHWSASAYTVMRASGKPNHFIFQRPRGPRQLWSQSNNNNNTNYNNKFDVTACACVCVCMCWTEQTRTEKGYILFYFAFFFKLKQKTCAFFY